MSPTRRYTYFSGFIWGREEPLVKWERTGHWFSLSQELKEQLFSTASHMALVLGFGSEAEALAGWLPCGVTDSVLEVLVFEVGFARGGDVGLVVGVGDRVGKIGVKGDRQRDRHGDW